MRRGISRTRWIVPLILLIAVFVGAWSVRIESAPGEKTDFKESSPIEIAQGALLALACGICIRAMLAAGGGRADFYWWVAPAFICFFMTFREFEPEREWFGFAENAFSWKYLFSSDVPAWQQVVMGVPTLGLSAVVLVVCIRRARLIAAMMRRRSVRLAIGLFVLGLGLYGVAQVYDKAASIAEDHGFWLAGVRGHRDDFWEETLELAGAVAILLSVVDTYLHRPVVGGVTARAEAVIRRARRIVSIPEVEEKTSI